MALEVECPGCGHRIKVRDEMLGARLKCPACGAAAKIPELVDEVEVVEKTSSTRQAPKRPCPMCGELIYVTARVCRFCDEEFEDRGEDGEPREPPPVPVRRSGRQRQPLPEELAEPDHRKCPMCGKEILAEAKKCRFCGAVFDRRRHTRLEDVKTSFSEADELDGYDYAFAFRYPLTATIAGLLRIFRGNESGIPLMKAAIAFVFLLLVLGCCLGGFGRVVG
jgi:predicted RNA-binding Zn-ribbon protein involved in translation (DUF1610 family)